MKVNCKHCNRYQFTASVTTIQEEVPCNGCGAKSNYKICFSDATPEQLRYTFTSEEKLPTKLKEKK